MVFRNLEIEFYSPSTLAASELDDVRGRESTEAMSEATRIYDAPGGVKDLNTAELVQAWNNRISKEYSDLKSYHSRFFTLDYSAISGAGTKDVDTVRWAADPAEPKFCFDDTTARELSDWGVVSGHPVHSAFSVNGRRQTHNEYCEYKVIYSRDAEDRIRPKRVVFTTELREYWMMLAELSPEQLLFAAEDALNRTPAWEELYGPGVADPNTLTPEVRKLLFATWVSGAAGDSELMAAGAPRHPIGTLNNQEALFMTHQINGLDDLLYIVLYGAHPYARNDGGTWVKATKDEIFSKSHFGEGNPPIHLACRHADPAAAIGAAHQAFEGRQLAFANPLGMYILGFADADYLFDGAPVPEEWIRFSRGKSQKFYQRLEFGPPDDVEHYLDEITFGDEEIPVTGGFQIARRIEVGPWVRIGEGSNVSDAEYRDFEVEPLTEPYNCSLAGVCRRLKRVKDEFDEVPDRFKV
ncbi:hypothetical protein [Parasphingorhabdus sp.]|uniref:hypothetical protein n=1 Tax=Parasphingorhabdus sp. TaxID=2709688 RepID=UPI003296C76E